MFRLPTLPVTRRNTRLSWRAVAKKIVRQQSSLHDLSDEQLRKQSLSLKYRAQSGESLESLLIPAFALVREAARRSVGMEHYEVQILGGIAIHYGSVAVMQTGEGKTLTATLPMYLAALTGQGAHLATANDYLAARDAELMKPIYQMLGTTVGVVTSETPQCDRGQAYLSDITYSTAKEIGFDFLRDRLLLRHQELEHGGGSFSQQAEQQVQRELNFILVDEADSILIDEARTPLIVSAAPDAIAVARAALYRWSAEIASEFIIHEDFELDTAANQVELTTRGRQKVRKLAHPDSISEMPLLDIYEFVEQAILVSHLYFIDRHYVIRDNEVVIVDEFTGRLAEGRKWRAGLHQAIEAREQLEVSFETGEAARITIQDLFLRYDRIAGMTGTIASSARELQKIYQVRTVHVPTNRPPNRKQWPDLVFGTEAAKWQAVVDEVIQVHQSGRPVLIGTRSIDKSEIISRLLREKNIQHDVLNASQVAREAEIVAAAGQAGKVTVATNMAGRGTDIQLDAGALSAGGLHVICTELHESARIDRQLIGRSGRQGDPGTYRQFMSLEDDILETGFGEGFAERIRRHAGQNHRQLKRFAALLRRAQARIERKHFHGRKTLLYFEKKRQEVQREMGQDPYLDTPSS